jgi:hypothetical protein
MNVREGREYFQNRTGRRKTGMEVFTKRKLAKRCARHV